MNILDQFKLDGQTALVTGCKRGIGKAMATALAEAGADIIGVSATLETEGSEVEKAVNARGRKFKGYACDFSDRHGLYRFINQVKSDFPQIDILINIFEAAHAPPLKTAELRTECSVPNPTQICSGVCFSSNRLFWIIMN